MVQELKSPKTILGLTGTFGSGKSTTANFFKELGATVIDADALAHEALMKESPVYEALKKVFQGQVEEDPSGIKRGWLAGIIFENQNKRKEIESIIHPFVFSRIAEEIALAETKIIVVEVPLLFESGFDKVCHQVIVVSAPEKQIQKRLAEKGVDEQEIKRRVQAQMPLDQKIEKADLVIDNSGEFKKTRKEVEKIFKKYQLVSKGAL